MRIERIAVGDIVLCSVGGRRIYGEVSEITAGVVHFRPLSPAAGWRHAVARQVIAHWRRTGRARAGGEVGLHDDGAAAPPPPREQLSLPLH
jgi:translation initiation factor 2 gamma subunit (eIF-2gamma)